MGTSERSRDFCRKIRKILGISGDFYQYGPLDWSTRLCTTTIFEFQTSGISGALALDVGIM